MGPSEKTFNQVKNILGKLDRNIDQLRQARQTPATPPVAEARPVASVAPAPARPASQFGRATPLRP